ncbi:MAG: carboxypeptidase-like regulatory domain-containing protein [Gemmataceae bacterium]
MGKLRLVPCLLCLVFLMAFLSGCQIMYSYRPLPVLVRDAETKQPIANANVHLSYPLSRDSLAPFDSSERSGADGVAHLRAAPYGDFGARVEASASGYLSDQVGVASESIQLVKPAHPFEETQRRKPEVVLEMYAEPRFAVELVVPTGFHGRIKAEIEMQDNLPVPPRQRCFRYEVVDSLVRIKGPGLVLRRVYPSDYRASYADGSPLTGEMSLTKVGFRWLSGRDAEQYFVVGTQSEYDVQRRYADDKDTSSQRRAADSTSSSGGSNP